MSGEPNCIHFSKKTGGGFTQLGQAVPWACPWCHIANLEARHTLDQAALKTANEEIARLRQQLVDNLAASARMMEAFGASQTENKGNE
jgi:hypothetical protein